MFIWDLSSKCMSIYLKKKYWVEYNAYFKLQKYVQMKLRYYILLE